MLTILHKDGKRYREDQLGELLGSCDDLPEFHRERIIKNPAIPYQPYLEYTPRVGWSAIYYAGATRNRYELDPSLYTVSPEGMIAVDRVRKMVEEIKSIHHRARFDSILDTIVSKYIKERE